MSANDAAATAESPRDPFIKEGRHPQRSTGGDLFATLCFIIAVLVVVWMLGKL